MRGRPRRLWAAAGLALLLPAVVVWAAQSGSVGAGPIDPGAIEFTAAERELLDEALRGVDREPARPSLLLYTRDVLAAALGWFGERFERVVPGLRHLAKLAPVLAYGLVALVAILVGITAARYLRRRRRRASDRPPPADVAVSQIADELDSAAWRDELRRRLAAGTPAAAVEALWWWLAATLTPASADPAWTSRELLTHAGRTDLRPQVRRLDRMIYGADDATVDEVEALWQDLGGAVR